MSEENAHSEEGLLLLQKAKFFLQNKLCFSCRCLISASQQCYDDVSSCEKPRGRELTVVKTSIRKLFKLLFS